MKNLVVLLAALSLAMPAAAGSLAGPEDPGGRRPPAITYAGFGPAMDRCGSGAAEAGAFTSKFDRFWDEARAAGLDVRAIGMASWDRFRGRGLGDTELVGLAVFNTKGSCSDCHPLTPMYGSRYPLFTDFGRHNLGLPGNPAAPFRDAIRQDGGRRIETGLGRSGAISTAAFDPARASRDLATGAADDLGKHRTPTLRNVHRRATSGFVKAYGHNGYFTSLAEVVSFYNSRDLLPACGASGTPEVDCWPAPEAAADIDRRLGDLRLSVREATALVAFLRTLDDGYVPPAH